MACELVDLLLERKAFMIGDFTLSSGKKSSFYLDLRRLLGDPVSFSKTVEALLAEARDLEPYDTVVGLATAGIPWATALALTSGKRLAYVRSEAKEYGTKSSIEGLLENEGGICVLVDDVATTGGTLKKAIKALSETNVCKVKAALVIIDRLQGAREALAELSVELRAVTNIAELVQCMKERGRIDEESMKSITSELRV
ncbi:MAG: orotate phosphoribosyltransferase [Acidilobaceae archaeon]